MVDLFIWFLDRWVLFLVCLAIGFSISTIALATRLYLIKHRLHTSLAIGCGVFIWLISFAASFYLLVSVFNFPDPMPWRFSWLLSLVAGLLSACWLGMFDEELKHWSITDSNWWHKL